MMSLRTVLLLCAYAAASVGASCDRDKSSTGGQTANSSENAPAKGTKLAGTSESEPSQTKVEPQLSPKAVFETDQGDVPIEVEVVQTPGKIQRGLMYRQHMPPDHGMLFIFASERQRSFWMKNTYIALDMLFVTADKKVLGIVRDAKPQTLESRRIEGATQYVIEVNAGFCDQHGINAGTQVRFEDLPALNNPPL